MTRGGRLSGARLLAVGALALVLAACGGDGTDEGDAGDTGGDTCEQVAQPEPKEDATRRVPREPLDAAKDHRLVVETNCGSFTIELDVRAAPKTAASLVSLARTDFFDGTTFHRIVPGFVIQGGDPTGSGGGGPGYKTVDRPPADARYTKGVVAMAKTPAEPPGTAGSQFFVVTAEDAGLPPEYAIVGKVSDGLDVVERIGQLGDAAERPTQPVVIETVDVQEG